MILRNLAITVALLTALPATAHEVLKGPNGGRVVDAEPYHVELVVQARSIDIFVTDANDKPVAITGFKGLALLTVSGKAHRVELAPKDNRLSGTAAIALPATPAGVVRITTPDGKTAQGKYH
jgi:hypothetical protein